MKTRMNRRGMLLIATIIAMTLVSILGLVVVSLTTTSVYSRVVVGQSNRAYYLAESGWNYALSRYKADGTIIANSTYLLGNEGQFTVAGVGDTTSAVFTTVGIVDAGTRLEARRRLTYKFKKMSPSGTIELPFADAAGDFDTTMWLVSDKTRVDYNTTEMALNMEGQGGGSEKIGSISLQWSAFTPNPFLARWNVDGLLSYDIQVKIRNFQPGANADGISFRLDATGPNGYGVSFCEPGSKIPAAFTTGLSTTNAYVVLWRQTNGTLTRIAYSTLTAASGTLNGYYIKDYSTLLLNLREVYINGVNGPRQNLMSVYVQGTGTYPRNSTPQWQTDTGTTFYQITWNNGAKTITNAVYTSAGFDTRQPSEIGLHAFCGNSSPKSFFDDFYVNFGSASGGGGVVSPVVY